MSKQQSIISDNLKSTYGHHLRTLISSFVREMDMCIDNCESLIQARDYLGIRDYLHQMIGAARILENATLESLICNMSQNVKTTPDIQYLNDQLGLFKSKIDEIFEWACGEKTPFKALIIDKHFSFYLNELKAINSEGEFMAIASPHEFNDIIQDFRPNLIISEYHFETTTLTTLIKDWQNKIMGVQVVCFTWDNRWESMQSIKLLGGFGYLLKQLPQNTFSDAINRVLNGRESWLKTGLVKN